MDPKQGDAPAPEYVSDLDWIVYPCAVVGMIVLAGLALDYPLHAVGIMFITWATRQVIKRHNQRQRRMN